MTKLIQWVDARYRAVMLLLMIVEIGLLAVLVFVEVFRR
jgi:hypothetical protein